MGVCVIVAVPTQVRQRAKPDPLGILSGIAIQPYLLSMGAETAATSPAGKQFTHRVCSQCVTNKPLTPAEWPHVKGQPIGARCKLCVRARKRHNERNRTVTRAAARTLAKNPATDPTISSTHEGANNGTAVRPLRGELAPGQLQIAKALKRGASVINEYAEDVLQKVVGYALDPASVHHEWALKMLAERMIPVKLYTAIGAHAAGIQKDGQKQLPTFVINVGGVPLSGDSGAVSVRTLRAPITVEDLDDGINDLLS